MIPTNNHQLYQPSRVSLIHCHHFSPPPLLWEVKVWEVKARINGTARTSNEDEGCWLGGMILSSFHHQPHLIFIAKLLAIESEKLIYPFVLFYLTPTSSSNPISDSMHRLAHLPTNSLQPTSFFKVGTGIIIPVPTTNNKEGSRRVSCLLLVGMCVGLVWVMQWRLDVVVVVC